LALPIFQMISKMEKGKKGKGKREKEKEKERL